MLKRVLGMALAICMVVALLPVGVVAAGQLIVGENALSGLLEGRSFAFTPQNSGYYLLSADKMLSYTLTDGEGRQLDHSINEHGDLRVCKLAAGQTYTLTVEGKVTDSAGLKITWIGEAGTLALGQSTVTTHSSGWGVYTYVPTQGGKYVVRVEGEMADHLWLNHLDGLGRGSQLSQSEAYAGLSYEATVQEGLEQTFLFHIDAQKVASQQIRFYRLEQATSLQLSCSATAGRVGDSLAVTATAVDPSQTLEGLVWSSSDTRVATVTDTGSAYHSGAQIDLVREGSCRITATLGSASAYVDITVLAAGIFNVYDTKTITVTPGTPVYYTLSSDLVGSELVLVYPSDTPQQQSGIQITALDREGAPAEAVCLYADGNSYLHISKSWTLKFEASEHLNGHETLSNQFTLWHTELNRQFSLQTESTDGLVGESARVTLQTGTPYDRVLGLAWTVDDPSVATLHTVGMEARLEFLSPGTVTLTCYLPTATASQQLTFRVAEPKRLSPGESMTVTVGENEDFYQYLVADIPDDGRYVLYVQSTDHPGKVHMDVQGQGIGYYGQCPISGGAGSYVCKLGQWDLDREVTYTIRLAAGAERTGITLNKTAVQGWFNQQLELAVLPSPENSVLEAVSWTVSDPKVLSIQPSTRVGTATCLLSLTQTGTATVTATCGDHTATCTVTVTEPPALTLGSTTTCTVTADTPQVVAYRFVAPETGYYEFPFRGDWQLFAELGGIDADDRCTAQAGEQGLLRARLSKGGVYYIYFTRPEDCRSGQLQVTPRQGVSPVTDMVLVETSQLTYVQDNYPGYAYYTNTMVLRLTLADGRVLEHSLADGWVTALGHRIELSEHEHPDQYMLVLECEEAAELRIVIRCVASPVTSIQQLSANVLYKGEGELEVNGQTRFVPALVDLGLRLRIHYADGSYRDVHYLEEVEGMTFAIQGLDNGCLDLVSGQNTIALRYAGVTCQATVQVESTPIQSMQLTAKTAYAMGAADCTAPPDIGEQDWFMPFGALLRQGMELKITYKDGTTQTITSDQLALPGALNAKDPQQTHLGLAAVTTDGNRLLVARFNEGNTGSFADTTPNYGTYRAKLSYKGYTMDLQVQLAPRLTMLDGEALEYQAGGNAGNAQMHIDAQPSQLTAVYLRGKLLKAEQYTVTAGSTVITLSDSLLRTLAPDTYALEAHFTTGIAAAELTVKNTVQMHRMYNPHSGEHHYTSLAAERDFLVGLGWKYEGVGWLAPATSDYPVYRLYNPNSGDHHYTMLEAERDFLVPLGWVYEGIGWYSEDPEVGVPLHRLFNPHLKVGSHHYTLLQAEVDFLLPLGWKYENYGWYGVAQ